MTAPWRHLYRHLFFVPIAAERAASLLRPDRHSKAEMDLILRSAVHIVLACIANRQSVSLCPGASLPHSDPCLQNPLTA
jgi:hypothetical protein